MRLSHYLVPMLAILFLDGAAYLSSAVAQSTERVSINSAEHEVWNDSGGPTVNQDGSLVAFHSRAKRLASHDTNGALDVFVRNRSPGVTRRVSLSSSGSQGDLHSGFPVISVTGRFVAFHSLASNLVLGDSNGVADVFIRDRRTNTTERVSLSTGAGQGNCDSTFPVLSGDARYVAFQSCATNLVAGQSTSDTIFNIFVRDRTTGVTTRVSVSSVGILSSSGSVSPSISQNGRYVGFEATGDDLVSGDINGVSDALVHDRIIGITELVSRNTSNVQGNDASFAVSLSADGHYAAFASWATNLISGDTNGVVDCFVHDRISGATERVSVGAGGLQANYHSNGCRISPDGRYVAFSSAASNLVSGDTNLAEDVFVRDRVASATWRVSLTASNGQSNGDSSHPSFSSDSHHVVFESYASNLVANDTNNHMDVFVRDLAP